MSESDRDDSTRPVPNAEEFPPPGWRGPSNPADDYVSYVDLSNETARFDPKRATLWYGRGSQEDEVLCGVPPSGGGTTVWVLICPAFVESEADVFTRKELESLALGRNYLDEPVNRQVFAREAAAWLERDGRALPDDLDPAPPFDPQAPPSGRLARDWRPSDLAPEAAAAADPVARLRTLGRPTQARLVEYLLPRRRAMFDAIKHEVHGDETVGDDAVRKRVSETNKSLLTIGSKLRLSTAERHVFLAEPPE